MASKVARPRLARLMASVGMVAPLALAAVAHAQSTVPTNTTADPAKASGATVSEIIVTAQKRSERINDVPISITAETGAQLAKQRVTNPSDLATVVPGLTYQRSSFGVPVFTIRGIGLYDTSIGIAPTVSVYVDQVPLPYLAMTEGAGLDIERVEVLKGPQGTVFGENSTGGAINYIAVKPTTDFHAGAALTYGRFNEFDQEGYVSGPISSDARARFSIRHEGQDGWQESQSRPGDTLGSRDFTDARGLLDWNPTSRLKIELNVNGWYDRSETQADQFLLFVPTRPVAAGGYPESALALANRPSAPDDARVADWDAGRDYHKHNWFYQGSLRADYNIDPQLILTSITSYSRLNILDPVDADGTNFDNFFVADNADVNSVSQELRLAGDFDRLRFTVGGNFQRDGTFQSVNAQFTGSNSGVGPFRYQNFSNRVSQQVDTYSVFGSADYKLTSQITLQGGVRYTKQDRDFEGCLADGGDGKLAAAVALLPTLAGLPYQPGPPGGCVTFDPATLQRQTIVTNSLNEDNVSWRAGINWKPVSTILVYGNVTRGYKSGAFTPLPAVFSTQLTPVTQESVTSYEAGIKSTLLDNHLEVTAAGFYLDYSNKQILGEAVFPQFGPLPQLLNIPKSSVRGGEVEATWRPFAQLRVTGGATYVDSQVDDDYSSFDPIGKPVNLKGEAFPNTPKWQLVGDVEYDFPIYSNFKAYIGGNASYRSTSNAAFGENPTFRFKDYGLLNLRFGFSPINERWQVQVWARNVTDTFYWTNVNYYVDSVARSTGLPATYGITVSAKY